MRDTGDQRFYTADDVNHSRVREIMRDAGNRERPYPFAWLGIHGYKYLILAKDAPKTVRPDFEHVEPKGHDYGPHRVEDEPTYKPVEIRERYLYRHVQVDDLVLRQRQRINDLAYTKGAGQ